ncbi:small ribosomal subunit protein mS25-like [Watersipora subatra]|uniref:small ribosomal subunit protein mS25-like n=1 Tax=Watersipora subatra TaxID=2589382 RepID=UPI00355C873A
MPFMKGVHAFRNTLSYLNQGKIVFKHDVRVMLINYNSERVEPGRSDVSKGVRDLIFWHLNQIQYKNPQTQILTIQNMTPTPFLTFILGTKQKIHVAVDGRSKEEILKHVRDIVGKSDEELKEEEVLEDQSLFGHGSARHCICEVPGQVPCPAFVPLPKEMTGKYQVKLQKGELE